MRRTIKPAYIHMYTVRLSVCPAFDGGKICPSKYLSTHPSVHRWLHLSICPHLAVFPLPTVHWAWQAGQPVLTSR